jgi:hypothetical protein
MVPRVGVNGAMPNERGGSLSSCCRVLPTKNVRFQKGSKKRSVAAGLTSNKTRKRVTDGGEDENERRGRGRNEAFVGKGNATARRRKRVGNGQEAKSGRKPPQHGKAGTKTNNHVPKSGFGHDRTSSSKDWITKNKRDGPALRVCYVCSQPMAWRPGAG